jgi:acetyl esterase/lipase
MKEQIFTMGIHGIDDMLVLFKRNCSNPKYISDVKMFFEKEVSERKNHIIREYKKIGNVTLEAHIFLPSDSTSKTKLPVIITFHGGGWDFGKPEWAFGLCKKFASFGMVAISAQYRLCGRHQTTPIESIADAKSVIRWIRQNADEFNIDVNKIVASGWSAGGHIAACAGIIKKFDETDEDLSISSAPNAMVFWFAALNLNKKSDTDGWFELLLRGKAAAEECSPAHNIHPNIPPVIIFHGTEDNTVPYWSIVEFTDKMHQAKNICTLQTLEGQDHLFDTKQTIDAIKNFLFTLNILENKAE